LEVRRLFTSAQSGAEGIPEHVASQE
jgi:hypothetical protein